MHLPLLTVGLLPIVSFDRSQWAAYLVAEARRPRHLRPGPKLFSSANGHVLSRAAIDPAYRSLLLELDGIDADGMPLVLASRLLSPHALPGRCATTDLFHDVAALAEQQGVSVYFFGADDETNRRAVDAAQARYPRLKVAGRHHGFFGAGAEPNVVAEINASAPDILWVGLGVPLEQQFLLRNRRGLDRVGIAKTCGGLFDFLSGAKPRAPAVMQHLGVEWLYRLALEPRRLLRRYAVTNIHAAWLLATGTLTPGTSGDGPETSVASGTSWFGQPGLSQSWLDGQPLSL